MHNQDYQISENSPNFKLRPAHYIARRVTFPTSDRDNKEVWRRVQASKTNDDKILFVGYQNKREYWGWEAEDLKIDTENYRRSIFLSAGTEYEKDIKLNDDSVIGKPQVSIDEYNHIYADFNHLDEDVPDMIDSRYFDYIFIGKHTYMYMYKKDSLLWLYGMLHENGKMVIPVNPRLDLRKSENKFVDRLFIGIDTLFENAEIKYVDMHPDYKGFMNFYRECYFSGVKGGLKGNIIDENSVMPITESRNWIKFYIDSYPPSDWDRNYVIGFVVIIRRPSK